MSITVLGGGLLTTVQDRGRSGYQQFGVPVSGVVDPRAMSVANILVGNPEDAAVLECTMMGPMLQFDQDTVFAVTGGDLRPSLDGQPVPGYTAIAAKAGQVITVKEIKAAFDEKLGRDTGRGYIYMLLKRHRWRKLKPRSRHPKKASDEESAASKNKN